MALQIDVIKAGLETSVQDFPGRYGFWEQGFPPSGPFDMWSFRLANLLVGNPPGGPLIIRDDPGAAGLEITMAGLEVDDVLDGGPVLDAVVVGRIIECKPHPQADRLKLCQVDVGSDTPLAIVCGAPNAATDLVVPVALVGAIFSMMPGHWASNRSSSLIWYAGALCGTTRWRCCSFAN